MPSRPRSPKLFTRLRRSRKVDSEPFVATRRTRPACSATTFRPSGENPRSSSSRQAGSDKLVGEVGWRGGPSRADDELRDGGSYRKPQEQTRPLAGAA